MVFAAPYGLRSQGRGPRSTTALRFAIRTWIDCDCQRADLLSQSALLWPPRLAAPISDCWDESCLAEPLSGRDRIARLQPWSRGKRPGDYNAHTAALPSPVIVDFLVPALRVGVGRNSDQPFVSVHRMSRSSERTLCQDHKPS